MHYRDSALKLLQFYRITDDTTRMIGLTRRIIDFLPSSTDIRMWPPKHQVGNYPWMMITKVSDCLRRYCFFFGHKQQPNYLNQWLKTGVLFLFMASCNLFLYFAYMTHEHGRIMFFTINTAKLVVWLQAHRSAEASFTVDSFLQPSVFHSPLS